MVRFCRVLVPKAAVCMARSAPSLAPTFADRRTSRYAHLSIIPPSWRNQRNGQDDPNSRRSRRSRVRNGAGRAVPNAKLSDREGSTAAVWRGAGEGQVLALNGSDGRQQTDLLLRKSCRHLVTPSVPR